MRKNSLFFCLLLCILSTGCSWYGFATRNFFIAVVEPYNEKKQKAQFKVIARKVWRKVESQSPQILSKNYEKGFVAGFVDYLLYGGNGEPPAVPPWVYRSTHYDTPTGPQAIQDWYAGFRHGSQEAMRSGIRNWVVDPIALPPYSEESTLATPSEQTLGDNQPLDRIPDQPDIRPTFPGPVMPERLPLPEGAPSSLEPPVTFPELDHR
ncbi:MAG: hypothetical protein ACFCD0_08860 [Gemmataceae bacterium]